MKKLLILLFSILLSFNSYGEWTKISGHSVASFYVDLETIKARDGNVYWWSLHDWVKPNSGGYMSAKFFFQGDCGLNRYKFLSGIFYQQSMGKGKTLQVPPPNDWQYASPDSSIASDMNYVCDYVN